MFTSSVISAIVAWIIASIRCRNDHGLKYKEIITSEKIKWLTKCTEDISMCIKAVYQLRIECCNKESNAVEIAEAINLFYHSTDVLILMCNPYEENFTDTIKKFKNTIERKSTQMWNMSHSEESATLETINRYEDISNFSQGCQQFLKRTREEIKKEAESQ